MGAWGYGPFDSDAGCDALGFLREDSGARENDDGEVVTGTADQDVMLAEVKHLLTTGRWAEVGTAQPPDTSARYDHSAVYAAAGLVAAVLTKAPAGNSGTRLVAALAAAVTGNDTYDPGYGDAELGLGAHCGAAALLAADTARALLPDAVTAVETLLADTAWHNAWNSPETLVRTLTRLRLELAAA